MIVNALEGARLRVMTQLAVELGDSIAGVQDNEFTSTFALKDRDALTCVPLAAAIIEATPSSVDPATVAAKAALVEPDATVTLTGTETLELLLESVTANPVPEAGPVNDTVQVDAPGELTLDGEHVIELNWTAPATVIEAFWDCPFKLAVTVTTVPGASVPTDALNVALFCPAGTEIDEGTVRDALLELKLMLVGLAVLPVIPTEQTVDPLLAIVEGTQLKLLNCSVWAVAVREIVAV